MTDTRTSYSAFLREPSNVLRLVAQDDVLLERRDGDDLVLSTAQRSHATLEVMGVGVGVLQRLAVSHPDVLTETLAETLPWMMWLPDGERAECCAELISDLAASVDVGNFARFHHNLVAWRNTAHIWADPELAERLKTGFAGDGGPVTRP